MIPIKGYRDRKVAILGLGRTGMATARAVQAGGGIPICWDDNPKMVEAAAKEGFAVENLSREWAFSSIAALVVSPGIAHLYPNPNRVVSAAMRAGVPVDNDIGLFFRSYIHACGEDYENFPRVVAVTGSNGKSTTSALIHHILDKAGRSVRIAGNIGRCVLDIDLPKDGGVVVLELSSYQIELARALAPDVAVFTNLTPDHLERHGGRGGYFAAKRRLFTQGVPDRAIIGTDECEGLFLADRMLEESNDERVIRVSANRKLSGPGWVVSAGKGLLSEYRRKRQVGSVDLREIRGLPGRHNHQNACAAYAACRALGLAPKLIESGLRSYAGLPHRSQHVAERGNVGFVNDSKATNADAALTALMAFERIRWICGGLEKDGGIERLRPGLSNVIKAYVIGREAAAFAVKLEDVETEICGTMSAAVEMAMKEACPGETVLLAPAAASFDQYDNFEQRGDDFIREVKSRL
ncbi:MAG: UDP-N-acetylmuramoyl-L-alanine--D-glutamate ligase [Roseovarius sp.]|nr:UDP-N-acetylmuramoyl-L-alanine--D-glutamate ligase [Roseovarius sp.]